MNKIISFPHLGNYSVPISFLLRKLTKYEVRESPPITKKTLEIGSKYAPDTVCVPFKYNLGNFIETLDNGSDILIQAGGGCRYGYYSEVQEKILRDLGYNFEFINLIDSDKMKIREVYRTFKKMNKHLNFFKFSYYMLLTIQMIRYMDKLDEIIRHRIGFSLNIKDFTNNKSKMLDEFSKVNSFYSLTRKYFKYKKIFKNIKIIKPNNCIKIGIIGELYTAMEPFSSYFLEMELAKNNIEIKRFTNLTYLLFQKRRQTKKMLRKIKDYCTYTLGADGMDNVYRCKYLIDNKYDGIIHTKPFGCTPEVGAIPIIEKICSDNCMPIIFFSFDSQTSEVGIKTRLEAFYDMLNVKKG